MTPSTLDTLRKLSLQDGKSIADTALKTTEEVGELARAVLSRYSSSAMMHRFGDNKMILEEAVDVLMCVYSIAYKMALSDDEIEEMVNEKMKKWSFLLTRERNASFPVPFEFHITVRTNNIENFKAVCGLAGVKPIVLSLQDRQGKQVMEDVMTSSTIIGQSNAEAYAEMERIAGVFASHNIEVVRKKIETVPWHPAAPQEVDGQEVDSNVRLPRGQYFESHVGVWVNCVADAGGESMYGSVERAWENLSKIADDNGAHLSRNFFKRSIDGRHKYMVTLRESSGTAQAFQRKVDKLVTDLKEATYLSEIEKPIVEFSIYDTKFEHDAAWMKGSS